MEAAEQTSESGDWGEFPEATAGAFPPAGIKPQPGERVQLRLLSRNLQVFYTVRLIGYIPNRSILLTTPLDASGIPLILADGEQLEVRMVTGSNIYAFRAAIQRLCISPVHYLHLDYPAEVRMQPLRKSPWANVNLGASASNAQGRHELVHLGNLSADGAQLHAPAELGAAGALLQLEFEAEVDGLKNTLKLAAKVLHVHAVPQQPGMAEYGVAFDNVSAADGLWLRALVYRHIAEGGLA